MRSTWRHMLRRRYGLKAVLWLLVITGNALQAVSATHWHSAIESAAGAVSTPQLPLPDGVDHDCLQCQIAAQAGAGAPPPAPWALFIVVDFHSAALQLDGAAELRPPAAHAWQGRAPPRS